jgi:hypothetical protein
MRWNPRTVYVLSSEQAMAWRQLGDPLAALVVSPERAAWIEARYPYSDQGRPGIICPEERTHKEVRATDRDVPVLGTLGEIAGETGPWRTTREFLGNEDALVADDVLALAAD